MLFRSHTLLLKLSCFWAVAAVTKDSPLMMAESQMLTSVQFSSIQSLSCVRLFATAWTAAHEASLSIQLLEFTQTHVH